MKQIFYLLFLYLTLISCNKSEETRMINASKRYTEDYFFKKNLKIEIIDYKINSCKELNLTEADSIIKKFIRNKLQSVAIKLSGQTASDFSSMNTTSRQKFIDDAFEATEFELYFQKLKEMMGNEGIEIHAYLKYVTSDLNGNNKQNRIYEDCLYLLNKDFQVIDMMSMDKY